MVAIATPESHPLVARPRQLRVVGAGPARPARWHRLTVVALVAVVLFAVGYLVTAPSVDATPGQIAVEEVGHVVAEGETMWSIARDTAPAGEAGAYVERLVEVNGTATVTAGQQIRLPRS